MKGILVKPLHQNPETGSVPLQNLNRSPPAVAERKHAARIGIKFEFQLVHPVIHCRDWNVMFLTPCFASLPTGLKFMDSFRLQCDFFIFFHNDTVSFLCYEKSVSKKYSCGQIRMIMYLLLNVWKLRKSLTTQNRASMDI